MDDDHAIALMVLHGGEAPWCNSPRNDTWYVSREGNSGSFGNLHEVEHANMVANNAAHFPSAGAAARAYCKFYKLGGYAHG